MKALRMTLPLVLLACLASACSSEAPASPTGSALAAPTADSPADGAQLDNVRPTLTVSNVLTNQKTTRAYEFEVSDSSTFATNTLTSAAIAEDASGKTKFTVGQDLQVTTKYYWRSRLVQGTSKSDWSAARSFKTKVVGYNKPGALFDPLVNGETIGVVGGSNNVTFLPGQGVRLNDLRAYVYYQLPQVYSSGEMSMEVLGLAPDGPPGNGKQRVMSMLDQLGQIASASHYSFNVQYRGAGGAPANCITFKAILSDNANSLETDDRFDNIFLLDPATVYLFQAFWTPTTFRVTVRTGGLTGPILFDDLATAHSATNWNPAAMYAFIGTNNGEFLEVDGSRIGMIARNVWVGATPRPASLGTAIAP